MSDEPREHLRISHRMMAEWPGGGLLAVSWLFYAFILSLEANNIYYHTIPGNR
jgi:hypothetical protein